MSETEPTSDPTQSAEASEPAAEGPDTPANAEPGEPSREAAIAATHEAATDDAEPATDEPATDELATDEGATDEPAPDEPAPDELATEEPATEEPAAEEPAPDGLIESLRAPPPLGLLAALAALVELVVARVAYNGLTERIDDLALLELRRWARLPRNLAAVSGLIALSFALLTYLRAPGHASIPRRLTVAAFSGVLLPALLMATLLPPAGLRRTLVVFALGAASSLVTLFAMSGVRYRGHPALRAAVGLAGSSTLLSLLWLGLGQLRQPRGDFWDILGALFVNNPTFTESLILGLRHAAEVAWLGVLAAGSTWLIGFAEAEPRATARGRIRLVLFGVAGVLGVVLLFVLRTAFRRYFRHVLYGAFQLELLVDQAPVLYALPLGVALGVGLLALTRRDALARQVGCGLTLWLAAGYGPLTPIQLLYLALGGALLARAVQADDPHGSWRARSPWSRLIGGRRPPRLAAEADPRVERETYVD